MLDFYKNVIPDKIHEKLTEAIVAMMSTGNLPYYGEFALFINFYEAKNNPYIKTAGVNVTSQGMNFYWARKFIDSLAQPQVNFLLIHEEFHILFDHIKRSVGYNQSSANIVQDMIINQVILDEIMKKQGLGNGPDPFIEIPKDMFKKNSALFIPKEYKGEAIFEDLYEWYVAKKREWQEKNKEAVSKMRKESNKCEKCGTPMERQNQKGDQDQDNDQDDQDGNEGNKDQAKKPGDKGQEKDEKGKGKGDKKPDENEDGDGDGEKDNDQGKQPGNKGKKQGGNQPGGDGGEQSDGQGGQGDQQDSDGDGDDDGDGDGEGENGGQKCPNCGHEHNNNKSRQGKKDTSGNERYGKYGKNDAEMYSLETIFEGEEREEQSTLDTHLGDDIPQELKREIVESVMTRLKNRGLTSGDVEAIINKLRKTKKDYLREIKRAMSNHIFGSKKEKTIVRPNRRGVEGLKGHKKYKNEINVLLDTSGSMGGEFEKVLSYIFQNDIQMNLIQCDARVQQVLKVKDKKQLEKMKIRGLGGTSLMPGIDFMTDKKNKIYMYNTVILTDGWTDSLDFKNVKTKTLILSTACKCPVSYDNGRVKQIENIGKQD
jgi:predicted metal-dependent peptidase